MALQIKTTGYEDYLDGSGNIKMLVIGGPDAGKTRSSSYWPRPFYMDCENSRGSLADRNMPYVEVKNSKDALDALSYLKSLERIPKKERLYQTVVLDTLDAFQRSVKDEWLQDTKAGSFKGYDAWGYLDTKMTMLMTRLLNLDYNVLVLVHYKDKTLKDDDGKESRELMLQLQGDIKDTAFNDFALVGWLGTYWDVDPEVGRVEKRGLTFKKTPEKPFLKDRFHILPNWVPIAFEDKDYQQIYDAFLAKLDERDLKDSQVIGEVPDAPPEATQKSGTVVAPLIGGPVAEQPAVAKPIEQMGKPELLEVVQKEGIKVKGNALKAELIEAIKAHRAAAPTPADPEPAHPNDQPPSTPAGGVPGFPSTYPRGVDPAPAVKALAEATGDAEPASAPLTQLVAEQANEVDTAEKSMQADMDAEQSSRPAVLEAAEAAKAVHTVNDEPTPETVAAQLGAEIVSDEKDPTPPPVSTPVRTPEPAKANGEPGDFMAGNCAECDKALADQNRDYVRLSFIKFRRGYLCDEHYAAARTAGK